MAADMLNLGSGIAGRAEISPFDKDQISTEAASCSASTGVQQLQQQQSEAECCGGYNRLLLSGSNPAASFFCPGVGVGAGRISRNNLYPGAGPSDPAAAFGDCNRSDALPLQNLASFSTETSTPCSHAQLVVSTAAGEGNASLSTSNTNEHLCSPTAPMRTAASGLKAPAPPSTAPGASHLSIGASCTSGRAPPGLQLGGSEEVLAVIQHQKQQGQQQAATGHFLPHCNPQPFHPPFCQQQKQRQELQHLQQLQRQYLQGFQMNQPQLLHQQLQQQLQLQQQVQHQQQLQQHQSLLSSEQHLMQRELRLQFPQSIAPHSTSDSQVAYDYLLPDYAPLNCCSSANRWMGVSCTPTGAENSVNPPAFPSTSYGSFKIASGETGLRGSTACTTPTTRRMGMPDERVSDLAAPASFEVWQAKQVLGQRESRPLRLSRFEMVEAYAKSTLCLSCDSMEHKITNCPFGEFVCPNCHRSSHRGEHCPLPCRFCFERHAGISVNECIRRTVRQPLERLLGVKMPLDASLSRRQKREASSPNGESSDLATLALRKADRPNTPHGRSVYVSNMLPGTSKESLRSAINFLLDHGQVVCVEMRERSNYLPYAFVELSSLQAAYELVQYKKAALVIGDQELKVQFKKIGLACTTPTRNSIPGSGEEVETQKRSPVSLMAPFTPTGQTVQDVCRLVAYKLAHDFGLPSPGPPPLYPTEDADALALLSRTVADESTGVPVAPLGLGLTSSTREMEGSKGFNPTLPSQEGHQAETETGCQWIGETKVPSENRKTFNSQATATDITTENNLQTPHQVQTLQHTSQQLYSRYMCSSEPPTRAVHCTQRPLELPPNESRQLPLQLHAIGAVSCSERQPNRLEGQKQGSHIKEQQPSVQTPHQQKCLRATDCLDAPRTLSAFSLQGHQLMPGVHSAVCAESPTHRNPIQSFGESGTTGEQRHESPPPGAPVDCQRAVPSAEGSSLKIDSASAAAGVKASRTRSFEDLTPFPGVLTSEMAPVATLHEAWGFPSRGAGDPEGKGWKAQQGEDPMSNATASTSLSASLGCDSLPSPSTCRSHAAPKEKEAQERGSGSEQQASSIQKSQNKPPGLDGCPRFSVNPGPCFPVDVNRQERATKKALKENELERHKGEAAATRAGNTNNGVQEQQRQNSRQEESNGECNPLASTGLMRPGTGTYFQMGVSGLMMSPAGSDALDEGLQDRVLSFSQPRCYRQRTLEKGDTWWTADNGSPRAFSRRAHQMGLPSLVHALKPDAPLDSESSTARPPFLAGANIPLKPTPSPPKGTVSCSALPVEEEQLPARLQSREPGQAGAAGVWPDATPRQSAVGTSVAAPLGSSRLSCLEARGSSMAATGDTFCAATATDASKMVPLHANPPLCSAVRATDEEDCFNGSSVNVESNAKGSTLFPNTLKSPPLFSEDLNKTRGSKQHAAVTNKIQLPICLSTEGYLLSAGSLASSTAKTAAYVSPSKTTDPCVAKQNRGRISCRMATPTPRKASSSDPRGAAANEQNTATIDCCASAREASPYLPICPTTKGMQMPVFEIEFSDSKDSQVFAHVKKECAEKEAKYHEQRGATHPSTAQDTSSVSDICFALTGTAAASGKQQELILMPSAKAEASELEVQHVSLLGTEEVGQEPHQADSSSAPRESIWAKCSGRKDMTPTQSPSASDPSVELLLAQIDDITKQLPPKVIEAVWASLASARANASTAAGNPTAKAAEESLCPSTAGGTGQNPPEGISSL